jgi:hypothetical protein
LSFGHIFFAPAIPSAWPMIRTPCIPCTNMR